MAFDPPFVLLPFLQCLHALSFCATHMGAMQFLDARCGAGSDGDGAGRSCGGHGAVFSVAMALVWVSVQPLWRLRLSRNDVLVVLGLAAAV